MHIRVCIEGARNGCGGSIEVANQAWQHEGAVCEKGDTRMAAMDVTGPLLID